MPPQDIEFWKIIFVNDVIEIYEHPEKYIGDSSGFIELDKLLRGFRGGEVTVWTGQNGSGKSTILNQFSLFQTSQGRKCCIASLEMRPENVLDSKLLELFEYVVRRYGIKHLIIDSLMKITFKEGEKFVNQVDFLNKYIELCKKFNVHGHIVAHPRKKENDKSKLDKTDVKGFSELTDLADNVIIWRNMEDKADLEENEERIDGLLILRKNRKFGELGSIPIIFDPTSRRFMCKDQYSYFK
jgi:twinkle protein